jgi:hypothetical protein
MASYAVGLAFDRSPIYNGVHEAFVAGIAGDPRVRSYIIDDSSESVTQACALFAQDSQNAQHRAFVAGTTTDAFFAARAALPEDVLVLSLGCTFSDLSGLQNAASVLYSDEWAAAAMVNTILFNHGAAKQRIFVAAMEENIYAKGYVQDLHEALKNVPAHADIEYNAKTDFFGYARPDPSKALLQIRQRAAPGDIIIFVGYAADLDGAGATEILRQFPGKITLYCSDTAGALTLLLPNVQCYVAVPDPMDYTGATENLYRKLFAAYPYLLDHSSYNVPFAYDCASQLKFMMDQGLPFDLVNFSTSPAAIKAALETSWVDARAKRPPYGIYLMCQTQDEVWSEHIRGFRQMTLGSSHTLPKSAAVGIRAGTAPWKPPSGIMVHICEWQRIVNKDDSWIFTRLNFQGLSVDTSLPYRSNKDSNNPPRNMGVFDIPFQQLDAICAEGEGGTEILNPRITRQFPLTVSTIRLHI